MRQKFFSSIQPVGPRRFATLIAGLLFLAMSAPAFAQDLKPVQKGQPKLVVEDSTHNWGRLLKGEKYDHTFTVRNDGDATLFIEKVKST